MVIDIRPRSAADAPAIARVRRQTWFAAYTGFGRDGAANVLTGLGGVLEVRYARDL